jgi:hypothetical protein
VEDVRRVNFPASKSCSSPLMICSIEPSSGPRLQA